MRYPGLAEAVREICTVDEAGDNYRRRKIMHENTEFSTSRDIEAIQIPAGTTITIPAGTPGVITQSLGGGYTIATNFGLSRVAEKDGDALGLEKAAAEPTRSSNGA